MNTVFFDSKMSDEARRRCLYGGQLFVYSPTWSSLELCRLARELAAEAFGSLDPQLAQFSLPVERYVEILAALKPKFTTRGARSCSPGYSTSLAAIPKRPISTCPGCGPQPTGDT